MTSVNGECGDGYLIQIDKRNQTALLISMPVSDAAYLTVCGK